MAVSRSARSRKQVEWPHSGHGYWTVPAREAGFGGGSADNEEAGMERAQGGHVARTQDSKTGLPSFLLAQMSSGLGSGQLLVAKGASRTCPATDATREIAAKPPRQWQPQGCDCRAPALRLPAILRAIHPLTPRRCIRRIYRGIVSSWPPVSHRCLAPRRPSLFAPAPLPLRLRPCGDSSDTIHPPISPPWKSLT